MSKKSYGQKSPILGLPVLGHGDRIIPEVELYRAKVIENMLIAGTQGVKECLFDEGFFRLVKTSDDTYDVVLAATGKSPSASGMVSGAFFHAASEIHWKDLKKGNDYWLYLRGSTTTFSEPSAIRPVISRHPLQADVSSLLMGSVSFRVDEPKVNAYPDGKIYSKDVARHASDKENPHGRRLYQEELVVTKKLILRNQLDEVPTVEIEVDGEVVEFPATAFAGAVSELAGRAVEVIDFESFGPSGGVINVKGRNRVVSATIQRRVVGEFKGTSGEVAVGYFSEDDRADVANEFVVYNSGDEGLPMRAVVLCG